MSAVVTIKGHHCHRRKNCKEDAQTISLRRVLNSMEQVAYEEQDATALAVSWNMAAKLPCNNLRLIAGTRDERKDFEVRLAEKEIAEAEREAFHGKMNRARALHGKDAVEAMYPENERLFERYRQATLDVAVSPVFTASDLRRKKAAIGQVWLTAEGPFYDCLRNGVAADERRLSAKQGRA